MAILKHISSKNFDYNAVVEYLTKEHNEETGEPVLNEHGEKIERKEYLISGINCTPEDFAAKCYSDSIRFGINNRTNDVKTHQYILSFDPKDKKKGLTLEAAYAEGVKFAKKNFPGHRVIVCAHPDGGNLSGNIHVHIVISAVRFEEREPDPEFMTIQKNGKIKSNEYKAGCKHQDTGKLRRYLNEQLQEFCRVNGYTVAEDKPKKKITDREQRAKKSVQKRLDSQNEKRKEQGIKPTQTNAVMKKDELRTIIDHAASIATSWDEFADLLRNHYIREIEQKPEQPRIPYKEKQDMWAEYKAMNEAFWIKHKKLASVYKGDVSKNYTELKKRKNFEWQIKNRKSTIQQRIGAQENLRRIESRDDLKYNINIAKNKQEHLKLHKDTYQAYAKALKIALSNNLYEDAQKCMAQMRELSRRQDGYWTKGWVPEASEFRLEYDGTASRVTWMQTQYEEFESAEAMLERVEGKAAKLQSSLPQQPEIKQERFIFDVKMSRGVISYKHPDLERWTRGNSLGKEYEREAIAQKIEENRRKQEIAMQQEPKKAKEREWDAGR